MSEIKVVASCSVSAHGAGGWGSIPLEAIKSFFFTPVVNSFLPLFPIENGRSGAALP